MYASGVVIGMAIIRQKHRSIRKDRQPGSAESRAVVAGCILHNASGRQIVVLTYLLTEPAIGASGLPALSNECQLADDTEVVLKFGSVIAILLLSIAVS